MAHHKDAIKRIRTSRAARARNRAYKSRMRGTVRSLNVLIEAGDIAGAKAALPGAVSVLHRLGGKGVIHRRNAARRVSRLAAAVNKMESAAE